MSGPALDNLVRRGIPSEIARGCLPETMLRISSDRSDVYRPLSQRTLIEQRSVSYTKK